jgi:hypothetical protein
MRLVHILLEVHISYVVVFHCCQWGCLVLVRVVTAVFDDMACCCSDSMLVDLHDTLLLV